MLVSFLSLLAGCSPDAPAPVPAAVEAPAAPAAPAPEGGHAEAGGEHSHASPHGGIVKTVGDMHVEALMMPMGVMFYLSDGAQAPLPIEGWTGNAVVKGPSGVVTVDLAPMGDHLHAAAALVQGKPASAVLTLEHNGKTTSTLFETTGVGLESHDHTSLHGGQVSMWGDIHVEYAVAAGEHRVWVSDEQRNAVTGEITGSVKDGDATLALVADKTGALAAKGEGAGTRPVTIDLTMDGKSFSLGFNAATAAAAPAAAAPTAVGTPAGHEGHDHEH